MSRHETPMAPQDWRGLSLQPGGRSLVEASAGTGKTWTISVLYLRLLLEQGLSPRKVVVTTFTNAAAEELRERLRARLLWALRRAIDGSAGDAADLDEQWLHQRWQATPASRQADADRLKLALSELDVAPITTLHGLCRRILADQPFAAGAPFVLGELADGKSLGAELVLDLWRRCQQSGPDDALALAFEPLDLDKRSKLASLVPPLLEPGTRIADPAADAPAPLDASLAPLLEALAARKDLHMPRTSLLKTAWSSLATWLHDQSVPPLEKLVKDLRCAEPDQRSRYLLPAAAQDAGVQQVLAFTLGEAVPHLQRLVDGAPKLPPRALLALAEEARALRAARLATANQLDFADLIGKVHAVLVDPDRAAPLADALFQAWPVALVDEFQDTDGLQYGILDRIYRGDDGAQRGRLVMIGDPKQAIYRFRGGDIHAYLRAADAAVGGDRLGLQVNHRSSRALVSAFNGFYATCGVALSAEDQDSPIRYVDVEASDRQDATPYCVDGTPVRQVLQVHYETDYPASLPARRTLALEACANQIADMLQSGRHGIGARPVEPADIAVLLPKNAQLEQLRDLLKDRGVPCVTTSRASVFSTDTARELQVLLHAVAHCDDLGPLRAAIATRLWGGSYDQLRGLGEDPASWQLLTEQFRAWRRLWQQRGVQSVVAELLDRTARQSLDTRQGERQLTDLRHLGELLQEQSAETPGAEQLLDWLADQRDSGGEGDEDAADARQLRIESDAKRVRLMTLHVSKGLEFPIVFLPLMWDHRPRKARHLCVLGDPDGGGRRVASSAAAIEVDLREQQDEGFRVLYVALTRAIHACHVFALPPDRPATGGKSAKPDTGTARSALDAMLARMQPALASADLASAHPHIGWVAGWHPRARVDFQAPQDAADGRQARPLPSPPPGPLPARHSFTTLTHGLPPAVLDPEAPANDEVDGSEAGLPEAGAIEPAPLPAVTVHPDILALSRVRGADFGNAVHAIFELRVPGQAMAEQGGLIRRQLGHHNVGHRDLAPELLESLLAKRLQAVLDTPLHGPGGPRLGALAAADLRAEMEFNFAIDRVSLARLRHCAAQHGEPALVPANARTLAGLMNGKIDLVFRHDGRFHVLDYKGNHYGDGIADYEGEALVAKMDASHYRFQALVYTLALDRYLRQRLPGYERARHLGDCWYVFIRAVGLAPGAGVWRHRFDDRLVEALQHELAATEEVA